jgi:hypothetical protein
MVKKRFFITLLAIFFWLFSSFQVLAVNYGEGSYGSGDYNIGEQTPTPIPSVTPAPTLTPTSVSAATSNSNNNAGSSNSSPSAPNCNDTTPFGSPDLFQINTTKTTATLYFAPPSMPYSSFYVAFSSKPDSWEYGTEYNQGFSGGVLRYTINLLQPNTTYYFQVRAGNGCATGKWSNSMKASTTNSGSQTKTYYKNIFTPIVRLVKTAIGSISSLVSNKKTVDKPAPTNVEPNPIVKPILTTEPQKEVASPKPAVKNKFCLLWWCFYTPQNCFSIQNEEQ